MNAPFYIMHREIYGSLKAYKNIINCKNCICEINLSICKKKIQSHNISTILNSLNNNIEIRKKNIAKTKFN